MDQEAVSKKEEGARMKILQLCHKPPLPAIDGGCIAMNNITQGLLKSGNEVKLLTIFTHKHPLDEQQLPASYREASGIEGVFVDTRVNVIDAFSSLITRDSYNVSRFFCPAFDRVLSDLLNSARFDIVHLESLFMTPYLPTIRRFSSAPIILRSHNLEHIIWERVASGTRNKAKRAYLKHLAKQLKQYELQVLNDVDGIAAISERDRAHYEALGTTVPLIHLPFGIDLNLHPKKQGRRYSAPSLFHIGAMDWLPNLEGMIWFLEEVWPLVLKKHPNAELHLAGKGLHPGTLPETQGVRVHGEVDDALAFRDRHDIMIVPLLSAGGIRIKIIEAMAEGKAIVSTGVGAEGIHGKHDRHFLLADEASDFSTQICRLLENPSDLERLGEAARSLAEEAFDNRQITERLVAFYQQIISQS